MSVNSDQLKIAAEPLLAIPRRRKARSEKVRRTRSLDQEIDGKTS